MNYFTQSFADTSEILNNNPEWKLALKKIEELQKTAKIQDDRIAMLEMQSRNLALINLQITIKLQSDRIAKLRARIQDFETILTTKEDGPIKNIDPEPISEINEINFSDKRKLVRKGTFKYPFNFEHNIKV